MAMMADGVHDSDDEDVTVLPESEQTEDQFFNAEIETREGVGFIDSVDIGALSGQRLYKVTYTDGDIQHLTEGQILTESTVLKLRGEAPLRPDGNLALDFEQLWATGRLSDLVLKVEKQELRVHRLVLRARSPVFDRMLDADMAEASTGIIQISDFGFQTIRQLCDFMYTGEVTDGQPWENFEGISALIHVALKYEVTSLLLMCMDRAKQLICIENASDWMVIALKVQAHSNIFKYHCIKFMINNLEEIQCTEGWERLMKNKQWVSDAAPLLFRAMRPPRKRKRDN